ncbi:MAG: metal-dependent hydrolase [Gammaproteobacteria bacterium]|nr:hypothetical protein [Gammaproteobacteria bacterium]
MDNVTHTLIGVLAGEAIGTATKSSYRGLLPSERRNVLVTTMAIGSNLPDLDFLYSTVTGSKLDYLLHHRGHTHTFVVALVIGVLLWAACELWARRRKLSLARIDRLSILGASLLAPTLHILMDATNNYGVHPWWPFDNRWLYGDSVFIVEPLLWASIAPIWFLLRTKVARVVVALLWFISIGLVFITGMVPMPLAFAYPALLAALLYAGSRLRPSVAIAMGIAVWSSVTIGFMLQSAAVGRRVDTLAARQFPQARTLDRVLTPMPMNPICWELILIQTESDALVLRRAMFSMAPQWLPAASCRGRGLHGPVTAPLEPIAAPSTSVVQWHGEVRSSLQALTSAWEQNCRVAAFMRFARAPWLARVGDSDVIGDLRYDRQAKLGFAEIEIESDAEACPHWVPPWVPPLQVLSGLHAPRTSADRSSE